MALRMNVCGLCLSIAAMLSASPAYAQQVYWASGSNIGRANIDGTGVDPSFISGLTLATAVASNATHIFWAEHTSGNIGRANIDGTGVNPSFIVLGVAGLESLVVSDTHIFWADRWDQSIGRANLDGTGVNEDFITGLSDNVGLDVNATHIFWADYSPVPTIGRANLDGTGVDYSFLGVITVGFFSDVVVNATHIYWTHSSNGLGRANLDGTGVDNAFISVPGQITTGLDVNATHLFWGNANFPASLGRANLDGTGVNPSIVDTLFNAPRGIDLRVEPVATAYCTQTLPTSVAGCFATLSATDLTLATGTWNTTNIPRSATVADGNALGIYIFTNGVGLGQSTAEAATPYGTLCLQGFRRSAPICPPVSLFVTSGVCSPGALSLPVNCNSGALAISVGDDVNVQLWYRDPTSTEPGNAGFSNAIFYTVQ